jgi:hypothetical protein
MPACPKEHKFRAALTFIGYQPFTKQLSGSPTACSKWMGEGEFGWRGRRSGRPHCYLLGHLG